MLNNSPQCFQNRENWSAHKCAGKHVSTDGRKKAIGTRRNIVETHRRTCATVPESRFVFDYECNEWRGTQCFFSPFAPRPLCLVSILTALSCADKADTTRGVTNAFRFIYGAPLHPILSESGTLGALRNRPNRRCSFPLVSWPSSRLNSCRGAPCLIVPSPRAFAFLLTARM